MDMKTRESLDQIDRLKALEFDLQKVDIQINETSKLVEARNFDIKNR